MITLFLSKTFGYGDFSILIISTVLLLLIGELIPKYLARELPDRFVSFCSTPIRLVSFVLFPFVKLTSSIASALTHTENINEENISRLFDREDIQRLISESSDAGKLDEAQTDAISKVIDLGDQKVYEAMTPRTDIVGVEINSSLEELRHVFIESGYSKIPVYEDSMDNIKGYVHVYDLFINPENLQSIIRDIYFVPDTKKTLETLNEFLARGTSMAVVVDEFGGTAGVITVEDIIEEMVGEIKDEYDVDDVICKKTDANAYVISGKAEIDYINEDFELNIPEGDYETIGGYLLSKIGEIPLQGSFYNVDNFSIHVLRANKTKIELIKLRTITHIAEE